MDFMKAISAQFLNLGNIPNLSAVIDVFQENTQTNLSANNLAFFVREYLKLETDSVRFHTLPGRNAMIRGGYYWEVDLDQWVGIVNDDLNPYYQVITTDNLNILQSAGELGAVSTTGESVPLTSFFDFNAYIKNLNKN
jgi:anionic cell wall polymer biosynthesis LytR-Cps2A-Psr (LCP) family protein